MSKKLDFKYFLGLILFGSITLFCYCKKDTVLVQISCFFNWKHLNFCAGGIATIVTIVHNIKHRKLNFRPQMTFNEFNAPFSELMSFAMNPITLVCSLTLAKTVFIQFSSGNSPFSSFSSVELTFIAIVTTYLLYTSTLELINRLIEILTNSNKHFETPQAVEENDVSSSQEH